LFALSRRNIRLFFVSLLYGNLLELATLKIIHFLVERDKEIKEAPNLYFDNPPQV
jgi:hypothetical protein